MSAPAVYLVAGARTPFCKAGTLLAEADAVELGRTVAAAVLAQTGLDPAQIDETIFGCVGQPMDAMNIARVIALRAGVPESVPAYTVHRNCASGLEAITQAADRILLGRGHVYLAGGTESMSHYPLLFSDSAARKFATLARARTWGQKVSGLLQFRPADFAPRVSLLLGLTDPVCGLNMGQTAEVLARDWLISREDQDAFALRSHTRAAAARARLAEEITPVFPRGQKEPSAVSLENGVRDGQTMEALTRLRPIFEKHHGTVTAGNSSQITDGAAALLIMSETALARSGLKPLGRIVAHAAAGCAPSRMGLGPVFAIARAEASSGLKLGDAEVIEINEAFAAQVLACRAAAGSAAFARDQLGRDRALGEFPDEITNINGGAIALGHPVGATGARLILTALHELRVRQARRALVTLCVGGGQGAAVWLESCP
ncbi:MAG: thiolase family protein [Opitutaceae bacterium]|nr:thiolase family protein [Opitutaceae bacterium]